jgi:hypothetical protein
MADTYSKLLGLSETNPPAVDSGKAQPVNAPNQKAKKTSKLANQQTSKGEVKATTQEAKTPVSPAPRPAQASDTSSLTTKEKTKYGTYLTDESIQKIRIRAIETKRDDHQVLQEAVNEYFEKLAK